MDERHARSVGTFGEDGMALLASSHVAVVGCGGLGGYAIELLARCGVGRMTVVDRDVFEESNLNRQLLATSESIGKKKAECAERRIREIDPSIETSAHAVELTSRNAAEILGGCDVVVDALDSPASRLELSRECARLGIPIAFGAVAGWYGQAAAVWPGDRLYEELYSEGSSRGTTELGNIAPTCACVASHQAALAVRIMLGELARAERTTLLQIDLSDGTVGEISLG